MGRRALRDEEVQDKVLVYCERYGVAPGPEGLPPFPSGRRETLQHREWLTVYRALQRLKVRAAGAAAAGRPAQARPEGSCPVCARPILAEDAVTIPRAGRRSRSERLHPPCADLARLAEKAGPDAVARLSGWLWPRRGRGATS